MGTSRSYFTKDCLEMVDGTEPGLRFALGAIQNHRRNYRTDLLLGTVTQEDHDRYTARLDEAEKAVREAHAARCAEAP